MPLGICYRIRLDVNICFFELKTSGLEVWFGFKLVSMGIGSQNLFDAIKF